jgi:GNAT superfamily N-acetyltransferase
MLGSGNHDVPAGHVAMVVTHLQMMAPAPTRDLPLADGITFRQVTPDLDWYRDIFSRVGAEWMWFGRLRMDDATLRGIIEDPSVAIYTLAKDGQDEALLELDFREDNACELAYFGLTPKLIGSGAGRFLMDAAIRLAWAQPISRFHVHTCTMDSPQALSFYMRSGFTPYRRQVEVAEDPRLHGLLARDAGPMMPIID